MISDPILQIVLSAMFALVTAYALYWTIKARVTRDRTSSLTHALMGAAMFTMVWPWGMDQILLVPQIPVFALAALWFVYLIITRRVGARPGTAIKGHHDSPGMLAYHAFMMMAMLVMAVVMLTPPVGGAQLWINVISIAFAISFGVAALYYVGSSLASFTASDRAAVTARFRSADAIAGLMMAAGMAALFLPLISFAAGGGPHH